MSIFEDSHRSRLKGKQRLIDLFRRQKVDTCSKDAKEIECECEPDLSLLDELHESPDLASAWFNVPWTAKGKDGCRTINALVDSGSGHSMIRCHAVRVLGLPVHPLLEPRCLGKGIGGGSLWVREFVIIELECPLIGQNRVKVPIFVAHAREVKGLLIGTKFDAKYRIFKKIEDSKERQGPLPPGVTILPEGAASVKVVAPIFDRRDKGLHPPNRCLK